MKAYSLPGPWPYAFLHSDCRVVSIDRETSYRGDMVFRASKRFDSKNAFMVSRALKASGCDVPSMVPSTHPSDVLLFVATVGACVPYEKIIQAAAFDRKLAKVALWAVGPWCLLLTHLRPFKEPIPYTKGAAFIFDVPNDIVAEGLPA